MNLDFDIDILMRDLGVSITDGTNYAMCFLDSADELIMNGDNPSHMIGKTIVATIRTGALQKVDAGARITVDGQPYIVRESYQQDDGKLTRLMCAKSK